MFAAWRLAVLQRLAGSRDPVLAAVAAKGVKELTYHRDYAASWVLRLGDGTRASHRAHAGRRWTRVWPLRRGAVPGPRRRARLVEAGVAVDPAELRGEVDAVVAQVLPARDADRVPRPPAAASSADAGAATACTPRRSAASSPRMQSLARAHPGATW